MGCCVSAPDPNGAPQAYYGSWCCDDGTTLQISAQGKIAYKTVGKEINGMPMAGWKEPPDTSRVRGKICCITENFEIKQVPEGITVNGALFKKG